MLAETEECRQEASIGDDVPAKSESYVLVCTQAVAVIPEVVFSVHILEVQHGVLPAEDDFVPENNLEWFQKVEC